MIIKTMQVFFGTDCLPYKDKEHKVHYPIVEPAFQGASQVNEVKFYVSDIGGSLLKWIAVGKLPSGKIGMKLLDFDEDENGTFVTLTLTKWFTQEKGDLYVSLRGFTGDSDISYDEDTGLYTISGEPVVQSTGSVKITIKYATPLDDSEFGDITTQEIIGFVNTKLDKNSNKYNKVVSSILDINDAEYADYLNGQDIVYAKEDDCLYKLIGDYPYLTYNKLFDFFDVVTLSDNQTITGTKRFTNSVRSDTSFVAGDNSADNNKYSVLGTNYLKINDGIGDVGVYSLTIRSLSNEQWEIMCEAAGNDTMTFSLPNEWGRTEVFAVQSWVTSQINDALSSVYKPQGSASVSTLNGLTKTSTLNGYIYNMSDGGSLTNQDNSTVSVATGDNVVFIWNSGSWYWDKMAATVDLSNYVTLDGAQAITGVKTFNNTIYAQAGISISAVISDLNPNADNTHDIGGTYCWKDIHFKGVLTDNIDSYTIQQSVGAMFNKTGSGTNEIKWSAFLTFSLGSNTTFTFESSKINCYCEYKGKITNASATSITLTFNGVSNILCNDDSCTITNATNSTLVLPAGVTIELSVVNGKMVAINFAAQ